MAQRLCSAAEMKFYLSNFFAKEKAPHPSTKPYLKPNKNCNLTSWVPGCESGWACSSGDENIDRKNSKDMPIRIDDCQPCCEGFFCPKGLTCMMRKYWGIIKCLSYFQI